MKQIIKQIKEIYRTGAEINKRVKSCDSWTWKKPCWHISNAKDVAEVAKKLNIDTLEFERNWNGNISKVYFNYEGVEVFALLCTEEEADDFIANHKCTVRTGHS